MLRIWLADLARGEATTVLASHAYADGAVHVEINVAADVLVDARPDAVLSYLNTPTESFLAPADAVEHARTRAQRAMERSGTSDGRDSDRSAVVRACVRRGAARRAGPRTWGLSDTLVNVQGPNYAVAKRIQRWRAVVHAAAGGRVSSTVAPASWTQSVTKDRVLASVYAGARPFGMELFEPETARALMAAKLEADTFRDLPGRDAHPESVFANAAHGGLWRRPLGPRSALGVAAAYGAARSVVGRSR